jgi:hypothetical protein
MDHLDLDKNIRALRDLYPRNIEGKVRHAPQDILAGLPVWIKGAAHLYEVFLSGTSEPFLYLALPEQDMAFEHLVRIYQALVAKLKVPVLVVADALPAKHRPLLVKFNVAFIYKDESIYAPELGLKFDRISRFRATQTLDLESKSEALSPFGLKLVAGLLTHQVSQEFTLKSLHERLLREGAAYSMSKISLALSELAASGLVLAGGAGPTRRFAKNAVEATWQKVLTLPMAPFFREVQANYIPKERSVYCIAGESALAHYSNLGEPTTATVAMSTRTFREVYQESKKTIPYGDFGTDKTVQVWKERPQLFSIDGVMNPVEVFLSMRDHPDERVQMALGEMIKPFGLERKGT